jgi:hypothetical protein
MGGLATGGGPAGSGGEPIGSGGPTAGGGTGGVAGEAGGPAAGGTSSNAFCQYVTHGDVRAWLFHETPKLATTEIHPFLAMTTSGEDIPLKQLSMRYFFTGEGSGGWRVECLWVTQNGDFGNPLCDNGVSVTIVELDPPLPGADHYLEVSFPGVESEVLSRVAPPAVEARTRIWRDGYPTLNQSNDYSFTPTGSAVLNIEGKPFKQTARIAVYRNGTLIWGEEPCP